MNKIYSKRHIVFFGFLLFFTLSAAVSVPSIVHAAVTPTPTLTPTVTVTEKDTSKEAEKEKSDSATKLNEKEQEKPVPTIKLNVKSKSLVKGKTYTLKVYNLNDNQKVSFKSNVSNIVSVDEDGLITGLDYGTAAITVFVKEGNKTILTLTCDILVGPPAISVKWTKTELLLTVGKRTTLKTILQPYNTVEEAKFFSADTSVATVSTSGRITAKSIGSTVIYTILDNGKYDCCTVTVVDEETYQKLTVDSEELSDIEPQMPEPDTEKEKDLPVIPVENNKL